MTLPSSNRLFSWLIPGLLISVAPVLPGSLASSLPVLAQVPTNLTAKTEADALRASEAERLLQQGIEQFNTSQFEAAFQSWQQALQLYRAIKDRLGEGQALGNL